MPDLPHVHLELTEHAARCPRGHQDAVAVTVHTLSGAGVGTAGLAATYCARCATYEKGPRRA